MAAASEILKFSQVPVGFVDDLLFGQVGQFDGGDAVVGEDERVAAPLADVDDHDRVVVGIG